MKEINSIGLVGGLASGKDSFGNFIVERVGGVVVTTSDIAREYIEDNELGEPTRDLTRSIAAKLRAKNGADYLLMASLDKVPEDSLAIVSGLYVTAEVIALRSLRKGPIIHVDTNYETRLERTLSRARSSDEKDSSNFDRLNGEDLCAINTDQRLNEVIQLVDYKVDGNISIRDITFWQAQMENIFNINFHV